MRSIGIGIIGWGFMGQTHTHALRAIPLFYPGISWQPRLVSVCSRDARKAEKAKELLGFLQSTGDYRELLKNPEVDVVSICTPNELHEEMIIAALECGKHLYIDKPLTVSAESAQRILAASRKYPGLKSQIVLNNRFFPSTMRAKELIAAGRIGEVIGFNVRYLHSGSVDPNRPVGWKQLSGAGVLQDLGSHALDLVLWLCGDIKEGLCSLRTLYSERPAKDGEKVSLLGDDQALMLLTLTNGAQGMVEASKIATGTEDELSIEISGTKGALRILPMNQHSLYFYDNEANERGFTQIPTGARYDAPGGSFLPPKNTIGWDRSHIHCYYSFLNCVAENKDPSPTIADGAKLQRTMDKLSRSHEERQWVSMT